MANRVLLDTCVLYPAYLRDTLLRLAEVELFSPAWSAAIFEELRRNLIEAGLGDAAVDRMLTRMNETFEDADVIGYEHLVESMTCDQKDRHVLAAAVHGRADALVTLNVRDFPPESVNPHQVTVHSPDDLLLDLFDLAPGVVLRTLHRQAASHKREPKTVAGLLNALSRGGAPRFADEIRRHLA
ncbi:PIN domain-containing protein [Phytoactinopolyspora endophytica]|uniref:PIN domain-containing protein n=1 Tax=Phytoactinopolyspora endophytica TaxID=1642495 RepID=UPI00101DF136|nr:PIN domain-containing protein [Phytoactinopolyspora endophytica]